MPRNTSARAQGPPSASGGIAPSDLKRLLRELPALACAPEMEGFDFDEGELREATADGLAAPEVIGRLAGPAFHARLLVRLNEIKFRAWQNKNDALYFQADSARYYIEGARGPAWDNPLVVACYYKSLAERGGGDFTARAARAAVKTYERKFKALLAEKIRAHGLLNTSAPPVTSP